MAATFDLQTVMNLMSLLHRVYIITAFRFAKCAAGSKAQVFGQLHLLHAIGLTEERGLWILLLRRRLCFLSSSSLPFRTLDDFAHNIIVERFSMC